MPKLSHLRCFVAVAQTGSISNAAKRLHRSPSAVSMTLSNLENELGRNLFEADGKSRLTPFGSYVFEIAEEQCNRFDQAIASIEAYARNDFGRVVIAAVPSFASRYLPDILARYNAKYPNINLHVSDDSSTSINLLVSAGTVDVGIASPSQDEALKSVTSQPLLCDPLGIVCSPKNNLAQLQRKLRWSDLHDQVFIVNGTSRRICDPEFRKIVDASEIEVKNTTSLLAMISANIGVTSLPRLAVPEWRDDVCFLPTEYADLNRSIAILTSAEKSLSPAAAAFVDVISEKKLE